MKTLTIVLLVCIFGNTSYSQKGTIDSLNNELRKCATDSGRVKLLNNLAFELYSSSADKSIIYANEALKIAEKLKKPKLKATCFYSLALAYWAKSEYSTAFAYLRKKL